MGPKGLVMSIEVIPQPLKIHYACDFPNCELKGNLESNDEDPIEHIPEKWWIVEAQFQVKNTSGHTSFPDRYFCYCPEHGKALFRTGPLKPK